MASAAPAPPPVNKRHVNNVQVAVRCRPLSAVETARGYESVVAVDDQTTIVQHGPKERTFTFDRSFDTDSAQDV